MVRPQFHFVENSTADYDAKQLAQQKNSTRRAIAEATFEARGVGTQQIIRPITFSVTFAEEPHFTSGCATVVNADEDTFWDPIGHCGIYQWQINTKGQYTGAYLWVHVEAIRKNPDTTPTLTGDTSTYTREMALLALNQKKVALALDLRVLAKMRTMMYLTFTGRAIKDIGQPQPTSTVSAHTVNGYNFATDDNA